MTYLNVTLFIRKREKTQTQVLLIKIKLLKYWTDRFKLSNAIKCDL